MADNGKRLSDGQLSFSGGCNSAVVKTIASPTHPDGVGRNQLAWLINATVRGGGITQMTGWQPILKGVPWGIVHQGSFLYQPDYGDCILITVIDGRVYRVRVDTDNSVTDLTALYGVPVLPITEKAYMAQAEMFLVIQAGDQITNPLFYDFGVEGVRPETLRQSKGFVGVNNPANEIPPALAMDCWSNRLWYSFGRSYVAGDIVSNQASGTAAYQFRDSVIHVTENPIATGGDALIVPTSAGNIRALAHTANLDTTLGQSPLFVFTRRAVYSCEAPITRADWTATTLANMPLQKVVLGAGGTYSDRSVVAVNQDLFFQSPPNGDIRSVASTLRYANQWGLVPLSRNVNRALVFNDRSLLHASSGINFDNRLWQTCLPLSTPAGVGFRGVLPLDFDLISSLEKRKPPAWEGIYDIGGGPYVLQLLEGDFGGRQRGFAMMWSPLDNEIQLWELTTTDRFQNGENRVDWQIETPAYTFGDPLALKELETLELWVDKRLGEVLFRVDLRPDNWPCWIPWAAWKECTAKDCREDVESPCLDNGYPQDLFCESFTATRTLPKPPVQCIPPSSRPSNLAYQFQLRITIKGWCRVRGIIVYGWGRDRRPFENMVPCELPSEARL